MKMNWTYFLAVILTILLFVGGPDYESHRIVQQIWDVGHVALFLILSYIILIFIRKYKLSYITQFLIIVALSFIFGLFVELIQLLIGRDFELQDLANDVSGAIIGYFVYYLLHAKISKLHNIIAAMSIVLLLMISLYPLANVLVDEVKMKNEFPVLSDFESATQLSRWDVKQANLSLNKHHVQQGEYSLQATFLPDAFPDITLQHFPRDWSAYNNIKFSLYNQAQDPIVIEMKIYDEDHMKYGYQYTDRFNRELLLQPGWNNISIFLNEIYNSPEKRTMDITKIKSFSLFLKNVTSPVTIFLDDLRLY